MWSYYQYWYETRPEKRKGNSKYIGGGRRRLHRESDRCAACHAHQWIQNGGGPTLKALKTLHQAERWDILGYLREMALYAEVETGGRSFVLTHAGLDNFSPGKPLEEYELEDFLFGRPTPESAYWPDKFLIFEHTPTRLL